jgi:hypothetical protein
MEARVLKKIIIIVLFVSSILLSQKKDHFDYNKTHFSVGVQFGMFNGVGGKINFLTSKFADNFPFSAKFSLGLSSLNAGDALAARKIFINNNTNGIPEQSGSTLNLEMDFMYKYTIFHLYRNYFYVGPRYIMFTGNFNYVGGNEDFDVTSNQWGVGVGVENFFRIVPSIDLVLNFGYDYYLSNTLYGHDTSYTPDGTDLNPREDYTFNDADNAINQPQHQLKAMIGFSYNFR